MKRDPDSLRSPWLPCLVALAVLALAMLPVLAALSAHRDQARRAERLLFERSAEVVAAHLRLLTGRQMGWQNGVRMRVSNRNNPPETMLNEFFSARSPMSLPENCRGVGYGALEAGKVIMRWQRLRDGGDLPAIGSELLGFKQTAMLLKKAAAMPAQIQSSQDGRTLLVAMTVAEFSPNQPRGWFIGWWDLDAMCADPQLRIVNTDRVLSARALEADGLEPSEQVVEIGEGGAQWRLAVGKGAGFSALFPRVSQRAIAFTGGGCAVLLALLAGFATRAAGLRAALSAQSELVRMKNHLLHSVSHEFRTPLSVILSSAELLESYAERLPPERRSEALAQIRESTLRMNEMIGQVLLLSRIEANRLPVEPRTIDLAEFVRKLARETEIATQSSSPIEVIVPEAMEANLDPTLLRAVLGNLLSNAVKFSGNGRPVQFLVEQGDSLRFLISNQGAGISATELANVYEPFFRASSASEIAGSGLGLTIAAKCAALLEGKLTLSSNAGATCATLTL